MSESIINKAKQGLINPCFVNLSFMYFSDKCEANNISSQKIALTSEDIKNGALQGITQSTFKNYVVTQVRRNQHKS